MCCRGRWHRRPALHQARIIATVSAAHLDPQMTMGQRVTGQKVGLIVISASVNCITGSAYCVREHVGLFYVFFRLKSVTFYIF